MQLIVSFVLFYFLDNFSAGEENPLFLSKLPKEMRTVMRLLPLWSNVMRPYFPNSYETATTAFVESDFNDLKNRTFAHESLPLRADEFVLTHIRSIEGQMILTAQAEENHVANKTKKPTSAQNSSSKIHKFFKMRYFCTNLFMFCLVFLFFTGERTKNNSLPNFKNCLSISTIKGLEWWEANRGIFKDEVFRPIILEVSLIFAVTANTEREKNTYLKCCSMINSDLQILQYHKSPSDVISSIVSFRFLCFISLRFHTKRPLKEKIR